MSDDNLVDELLRQDRVLISAELHLANGSFFQPTGFPDIGACVYTDGKGQRRCLVESEQSMANRLEAVCMKAPGVWREPLAGQLPVIRVEDKKNRLLATNLTEPHRVASSYVLDSPINGTTPEKNKGAKLQERLEEHLGLDGNTWALDGHQTERDDLLQALGRASPPAMWLPPVSFAEVPYYQPIVDETRKRKPVLHFDHFAVLSEGDQGACFCFDYDVGLSVRQQSTLASLLARITYFGRAESRARLSLVEAPPEHLRQVTPADRYSSSGEFRRRVLVTCDTFCASDLWGMESGGGHLVQAMIEEGRKRPPNTEWIDYALPQALVRARLPRPQATAEPEERRRVATVRFGLFRRVPIRLSELVRVAREIRDQAATRFAAETGGPSRRLTGREADGSVATGHRHAFWLPEPDKGTGYLQRVTVWLPDGADGIDQRELDALLGVQRIFRDDDYPILLVAERVIETCTEPTPSRRWRSLTPFLAPLHSRRGRCHPKPSEQLQRMVEETAGASPRVMSTSGPGSPGKLTTVRAHLYRRGTWRWTKRAAAWFDLEFDHPVVLPRPVGSDAHFGLGRFVPVNAGNEGGRR